MRLLYVDNLNLRVRKKPLWANPLSFEIPALQKTALLGANGSGKTSLIRAVLGDGFQVKSRIYWGDPSLDIIQFRPEDCYRWFSYLPQETSAPAHLTVLGALRTAFGPALRFHDRLSDDKETRIARALREYRIEGLEDLALDEISSGERQRVYLARAVLQQARVLVLDEPTNHLDPGGVSAFWRAVDTCSNSTEQSVVFSTHDLDSAKKYADHIVALGPNGLVFSGSAERFWKENLLGEIFNVAGR